VHNNQDSSPVLVI